MPLCSTTPIAEHQDRIRPYARRARSISLVLWLLVAATPLLAQSADEWWIGAPVATDGLGTGPYAQMGMLYERTFLKVDVLYLSLRFDSKAADRFERLAGESNHDDAHRRRVVGVALESDDVLVRSRFLRGISLDQFLDGTRENLADAEAAGLLSAEERRAIVADIEVSYAPLREPGIRAGDTLWYRIRGDDVHIVYRNVDGQHVVDERVVGSQHRRAILGGYLAPGSDFREPLVRSLIEAADR